MALTPAPAHPFYTFPLQNLDNPWTTGCQATCFLYLVKRIMRKTNMMNVMTLGLHLLHVLYGSIDYTVIMDNYTLFSYGDLPALGMSRVTMEVNMWAEFVTKTDEIRHYVIIGNDCFDVADRDEGLREIRRGMANGHMCQLVTEFGYFCRRAVAVMQDGSFRYVYRLEWHATTPRLDYVA